MGPKMRMMMAMAMMMGAMASGMSGSSPIQRDYYDDLHPNHRKKCFRPGCENTRKGNKLYCSAECCKLHKQGK